MQAFQHPSIKKPLFNQFKLSSNPETHFNKLSPQKQPKIKFNTTLQKLSENKQQNKHHNLSASRLSKTSQRSTHIDSNHYHIKLPNAFYNDKKTSLYLNSSKTLSEKSMCYQVRPLSLSERKRLQSSKVETIVKRRKTELSQDQILQKNISEKIQTKLPFTARRSQSSISFSSSKISPLKTAPLFTQIPFSKTQRLHIQSSHAKFKDYTYKKYNKLIYGSKLKQIQQKMLNKDISKINSQRSISKKWYSPYKNSNTLKTKFESQNIISKNTLTESSLRKIDTSRNTQLKVLNLDRLFRKKQGKLTNVVPLEIPKFSEVNARKNINLLTNKKNKDKVHDIIEQFNTLLRISKLKKAKSSSKIIGIKGKNFTKNPTFEQLMGLKLRPKSIKYAQQPQQIPQEIFLQHSTTYAQFISTQFSLPENLLAGLRQSQKLMTIDALTRFYALFVTRTASTEQKIQFFEYFFVPLGKQLIFKSQLKQILELMCKKRTVKDFKIAVKTQILTDEEKAKIFLQALIRVMFGQVEDQVLNRQMLGKILRDNQDAVQLLIGLIHKKD